MNWDNYLIRIAIIFVVIVAVHALYRALTGNSLDDDAQWYAEEKKKERERSKHH